jgi:hypothetical protein
LDRLSPFVLFPPQQPFLFCRRALSLWKHYRPGNITASPQHNIIQIGIRPVTVPPAETILKRVIMDACNV